MITVARCHIARGQFSVARTWLEKAAQIDATATQARSELRALGK